MLDPPIISVAIKVRARGGRLLIVGGAVRDYLLSGFKREYRSPGVKTKDVDLCVFGLDMSSLREILSEFGPTLEVGRKVTLLEENRSPYLFSKFPSYHVDASLPKDAEGNFSSIPFSEEALKTDALTRDFTVNALYLDPLTMVLKDPLGGSMDARRRSLVPVRDENLYADPIRMLRAMNLISRKGFVAHPRLLSTVNSSYDLLGKVPRERLWREWFLWAESPKPHLGLHYLKESGLIGYFPELRDLSLLPQGEHFHPEGNVWNHTVLVVEAMSKLRLYSEEKRAVLTLSALLHDVGKLIAVCETNPAYRSRKYLNHAELGAPLTKKFLKSVGAPQKFIPPVMKLTYKHMDCAFRTRGSVNLKKIARFLHPDADLTDFWALLSADWDGRRPWPEKYPYDLEDFLEPLGGAFAPPRDFLTGEEIISAFGVSDGKEIGRIKKLLADAYDNDLISNKEEAYRFAEGILGREGKSEVLEGSPRG
jgi:tRNA nucleotidyltransferase/poly(A) polymerase